MNIQRDSTCSKINSSDILGKVFSYVI